MQVVWVINRLLSAKTVKFRLRRVCVWMHKLIHMAWVFSLSKISLNNQHRHHCGSDESHGTRHKTSHMTGVDVFLRYNKLEIFVKFHKPFSLSGHTQQSSITSTRNPRPPCQPQHPPTPPCPHLNPTTSSPCPFRGPCTILLSHALQQ